jgi:hypothetical protein
MTLALLRGKLKIQFGELYGLELASEVKLEHDGGLVLLVCANEA